MRILLTHSTLDWLTEARMLWTGASPIFEGHKIDHFIIELDQVETLRDRLNDKLNESSPDVVILHGGIAFDRNPDAFVDAVNEVIEQHPSITFIPTAQLLKRNDLKGERSLHKDMEYVISYLLH